MRLRYVILLQLITTFSLTYVYRSKLEDTYLDGVADGLSLAKKYVADREKDKVCSAWLFQTNIKEAKNRICGGKKV